MSNHISKCPTKRRSTCLYFQIIIFTTTRIYTALLFSSTNIFQNTKIKIKSLLDLNQLSTLTRYPFPSLSAPGSGDGHRNICCWELPIVFKTHRFTPIRNSTPIHVTVSLSEASFAFDCHSLLFLQSKAPLRLRESHWLLYFFTFFFFI